MKGLIRKQIQFVVAVFLALLLNFTQYCCANTPSVAAGGAGIGTFAAVGAGSFAAILSLFLSNINNSSASAPTPIPVISGAPVILSSSNHNLLSVNGAPTSGSIVVKNSSTLSQRYSVSSDVSPIVVDQDPAKSTCLGIVAAGATCTFNISYVGVPKSEFRAQVSFVVKDEGGSTDEMIVDAIGIDSGTFFIPSIDDTGAQGLPDTWSFGFVTLNQNGVEFLYAGTEFGIFKSSDNGKTWIHANNGLTSVNAKKVRSLILVDGVLYISTFDGVYKSINGGRNWILSGSNLINQDQAVSVLYQMRDASSKSVLYAGTINVVDLSGNGVFQSSDDGVSWKRFGSKLASEGVVTLCSIGSVLYAATSKGVFQIDTAIDDDWKLVGKNTLVVGQSTFALSSAGVNLYVCAVDGKVYKIDTSIVEADWVSTNSPGYGASLCIIGDILYASTDKGLYQINVVTGGDWELTSLAFKSAAIFYLNKILYASIYDFGVLVSNDGGIKWTPINNALVYQGVLALCSIDKVLYAATNTGVLKSYDYGANWELAGLADQNILSLYAVGNVLYAGTYNGVYRSNDAAMTWGPANNGLENHTIISSLYSMDKVNLYAGTYNGVFTRGKDDTSWSGVGSGGSLPFINVRSLSSITSTTSLSDFLYAGDGSYVGNSGGVYRINTKNLGATWEQVGVVLKNHLVQSLYSIGNFMYAAAFDVVYKIDASNIPGNDWVSIGSTKLENVSALNSIGTILYAGTSKGLYQFDTNGGIDWVGTNLKDQNVSVLHTMQVDSSSFLFAGISAGIMPKAENNAYMPLSKLYAESTVKKRSMISLYKVEPVVVE